MKNIFLTMSLGIGLLFPCKLHAQSQYPFQNTTLSTEERVDDLIKRMTLEEKIAQKEAEIEASASQYGRLSELMDEKAELERQYEEKMERWVYLNELAEKINAQ